MGKLILVRHGQSQWNLENRFTGWTDVPLTDKGRNEARLGAETIREIRFDQAFTSDLKRAQETLKIILEVTHQTGIVVEHDKALNERNYGELQGLNKTETAEKYGKEQVRIWRRSYAIAPPGGESLKDTAARTLPYFIAKILPLVKSGKNILVAAHGNSLRSIVMQLDDLTEDQVTKLELATGTPIVYDIDEKGAITSKSVKQLATPAESPAED